MKVPAVKMPSVQIPEFWGDNEQWTQFWLLFKELVHDKPELTYGVKFTYLKAALKGTAKDLAEGFTPNKEGYEDVVALLKDTFDNEGLCKRKLYTKFMDMKSPKHEAGELKKFRIEYMKTVRNLAHCVDVKEQLELIKEILLKKLHPETLSFIINFHKNPIFSYEEMDKAITVLINILEVAVPSKPSHTNTQVKHSKYSRSPYDNTVSCNSAVSQPACSFCNESHASFKCPTYTSVEQRKLRLMDLRACLKCGKMGHYSKMCRSRLNCFKCKLGHWSALCYRDNSSSGHVAIRHNPSHMATGNNVNQARSNVYNPQFNPHSSSNNPPSTPVGAINSGSRPKPAKNSGNKQPTTLNIGNIAAKAVHQKPQGHGIALPTAQLKVLSHGPEKKAVSVRGFFDCGAQCSFIHPNLVEELGLKPNREIEIFLTAFGKDSEPVKCPVVTIKMSVGSKRITNLEFLVTNKVEMQLRVPGLATTAQRMRTEGVKLADDFPSDIITNVRIIIGADHFGKFINGIVKVGDINMLTSPAGHLLYGSVYSGVSEDIHSNQVVAARITVEHDIVGTSQTDDQQFPDITQLWDLEVIGINERVEHLTTKERNVLAEFSKTIVYEEGQYWVPLPWKEDPSTLPTNYRVARGQLNSLIAKLHHDKEKFAHYDRIIQDYLKQGFIERVNDEAVLGHYLPHHCVIKQSPTTPIRIVFNASCKANSKAPFLNELLEKGPSLTERLVDCLVKFRTKRFAVSADISKAFLRIGLVERDRDYVRFLWVEGRGEEEPKVVTYRFSSVLFGSTSSPFLLQATLYRHFMHSSSDYKDLLLNSFYVDNFLTTVSEEGDLVKMHEEVCKSLKDAGMPLQLWNSNSVAFNEIVGDEERENVTSILGLSWNTQGDTISLKPVNVKAVSSLTKRRALSIISTVYDPLGLVSPVTLRGKLLMRDIWKGKYGWDESLPAKFSDQINALINDFQSLHTIEFPRCGLEDNKDQDLFVDCDASQEAYGACAYIVRSNQASLFMARTRVAPLRSRSIPQLELTALLVGCRLVKYICDTVPVEFRKITVRSDNQACICWVASNKSADVYVKNRVSEIQRLCNTYGAEICHVKSGDNMADIVSRGCSTADLVNSRWQSLPLTPSSTLENESPPVVVNEIVTQRFEAPVVGHFLPVNRYSSLEKLFNVTSIVFKYLELRTEGKLKMPQASVYWIRNEQKVHYPLVYSCLKESQGGDQYRESKQFIKDLSLYLDSNGILRSRGRICNAQCGDDMKYPILLPPTVS